MPTIRILSDRVANQIAAGEVIERMTGRLKDLEWREITGHGTVFSWTITHRGTDKFRAVEPYAVACVTFDEANVNHIANVVNCTADQLKVGMRVRAYGHMYLHTCSRIQPALP